MKKIKIKFHIFVLIFGLFINFKAASAMDFVLQPSGWFLVQSGDEVVFPKKYSTDLGLNLGLHISDKFLVLGKLVFERESSTLMSSDGSSQKFVSFAGGLGYHQNKDTGFFIDLFGYIYPTYTETFDGENSIYYGKYGYGLDFSYLTKLGSIAIGPMISIRKIEYSNLYANSTSIEFTENKPHVLQIKPLITVAFLF